MQTLKPEVVDALIESKDAHELVNRLRHNKQATCSPSSSPFFFEDRRHSDTVLLFWKMQSGDARAIAIQLGQPVTPAIGQWDNKQRQYVKAGRDAAIMQLLQAVVELQPERIAA
jgi:hypothetical protein